MSDDLFEKAKSGEPVDVILYQNMEFGYYGLNYREFSGSEYVTLAKGKVTFSMLDDDTVIQQAIIALDEKIKRTYAEAERQVSKIKDQKARLLSISFQPRKSE